MDVSKLDRKLHGFPSAFPGVIMESLAGVNRQK